MNNPKLAYDLHELLLTGDNINLVGDFQASGGVTVSAQTVPVYNFVFSAGLLYIDFLPFSMHFLLIGKNTRTLLCKHLFGLQRWSLPVV
jgi:hypothetical protein